MRTAERDLGAAARRLTRGSVLLAGVVYLVGSGDIVAGGIFLILFSLPTGTPLFAPFREIAPAPAAALRAAVFLFPILEVFLRAKVFRVPAFDANWSLPAHLVMILLVMRTQSARLPAAGHLQLIGGGLVLVTIGAAGGLGRLLAPALGIWIIPTAAALVRIHLQSEVQRTFILSRIRASEQDSAEEVAGRRTAFAASTLSSISLIGLLLISGGLLLFWFTPYAARGVAAAYRAVAGSGQAVAEEPGLPESPHEIPPFAIPTGVVGYLPFGPRLDRDDFLLRREQDGITVLIREAKAGLGPGDDTLVRGECYDFLTSKGRWIRSRRRERVVRDGEDGKKDERVVLDGSTGPVTAVVECLVPPGPDRTLYVPTVPVRFWLPEIVMDGTGNYFDVDGRSPPSSYVVGATTPWRPDQLVAADPGPEFLLIPEDLDREKLAELVEPLMEFAEDDFERAQVIQLFLLRKFLNLPDDAPERADVDVSVPPPDRLDVAGFLFTRRWGSSIDFATAQAMLLRSVGIPCRLATGYRSGTWLTEAEFYVFRADDLFAWVEVPFEGVGWFPFGSTPAPPELDDDQLGAVLLAPPEERGDEMAKIDAEEGRAGLVGRLLEAIDGWISSLLPGDRKSSGLGQVVGWLVLLGVAAMILRGLLAVTEKGRELVAGRLEKAQQVVRALFYERMLKILAKRGMRRRPYETPLEFARSVVGRRGMEFAEVQRLTNAFCATRYGGRVIGSPKETELLKRAERLGEMLDEQDRQRQQQRTEERATQPRRLWPFGMLVLSIALSLGSPAVAATPRELVENLGSEDAGLRLAAREELLLLREKAIPGLLGALVLEAAEDRREEIERRVRELGADDYDVRSRATRILKEIGPDAAPAVRKALDSPDPEAKRRARDILRYMEGAGRVAYATAEAARHRRRGEVLLILGSVGDARAVDAVLQAGLTWPEVEAAAANALRKLARRHPERFYALVGGSDPRARQVVITALLAARPPDLSARLEILLQDPNPELQRLARSALVTPRVVEETDQARLLLLREMREAARFALYRALKACPGYPEATWILVEVLEQDGDYRAALQAMQAISEPDLAARLRIVSLLRRLKQKDEAATLARNLLEEHRDDYRVYLLEAELLLDREPPEFRLAQARAERAIELAPEESATWAMLGRILGQHVNDPAAARDAYRRAVLLDSENEDWRRELKKYLGR